MFPLGALIGLGGQLAGGVMSIINNRNIQKQADAEAARQQAHYAAKENENPLARSEVQHLLGQYDRASQQQIENAKGVAAITGATPEFTTAVQKGVAEGRANLMGDVAANASKRADYYNQLGEQAKHQKAMEDQERRLARNQTYAALAANAASAVGSIMDAYSVPQAKAPAASGHPVTSSEQRKINTSLAQVGNQIKQERGLLEAPGIDYETFRRRQIGQSGITGATPTGWYNGQFLIPSNQ